ncbi:MBL fold metallo-hydrolase [Candidatus Micrarchaeota archaeon]|nr:MBL fold metallo-hydrolase [Candidatus Micrarchaeota archaeon]
MNDRLQRIAEGGWLLSGDTHPKVCSNVYVLEGKDSLALIDSGVDANRVREAVAHLGKPIETVFFTHGHFDHVQAAIKAKWGGQMAKDDLDVIHELNAEWVNIQKPDFFKPFDAGQKIGKSDVAFEAIHWHEFKLQIIRTPGHTPGSVSFFDEKRGILFSGDCKFADGGVGRTDFWGGNAEELEKSLEKIDGLDFKLLAPGHGPIEEKR